MSLSSALPLPVATHVSGTLELPGSKSISNRTLLLAALCRGNTTVRKLLKSDDTDVMLEALAQLGVVVTDCGAREFVVQGCEGRFPTQHAILFLGNAGTAFRPLTAALALQQGDFRLSGVARMHERPIGDLVDALCALGASIDYLGAAGYPPLHIHPLGIASPSGCVGVRGDVSSQFLSALLMALPLLRHRVVVEVQGELISKPYVEITLNLMARFGVTVERHGWERFVVDADAAYVTPGELTVEGDASSASYFLAAGAIAGGPVRVLGVGQRSIQGDTRFAEVLEEMGAEVGRGDDWIEVRRAPGVKLRALDIDLNHIPDAAMTIAIAALFADGTTTIRNIASWRVKETDRIHAMATELRKVGATVDEGADWISVTPPTSLTPGAHINTWDDHRMAMCFSLVSLAVPVTINDPGCVGKTFPDYFDAFARITHS